MGQIVDKSGLRFGNLVVIRPLLRKQNGKTLWVCKCDCGKYSIVVTSNLLKNRTKSCGCLTIEEIRKVNTKHGMKHTKFYKIWCGIKKRCNNIKCAAYINYGGRGIIYDKKWEDFLGFKKEMYMKYVYAKKLYGEECLSIERINVNEKYSFKNCTFIPRNEQGKNTRKNKWFEAISPEGKIYIEKNQTEFAREFNLNQKSISACLCNRRYQHKNWKFQNI